MKDQVVIITGTSSGIGKALAELAAEKEMKVVLVDINFPPSEDLAKEIVQNGGEAIAIKADLANPRKRARIIDRTMKKFGRIDYLINNAGYMYAARVDELDLKHAHHLFEVNFWAYLDLALRVVPIMKKQGGGTIIHVGSTAALQTNIVMNNIGLYTASKHAVVSLFKAMAEELKEYNINVKIACPTGTKTNIHNNAIGTKKEWFQQRFNKTWAMLDSPQTVAKDIFNELGNKEDIILPGSAKRVVYGRNHLEQDHKESSSRDQAGDQTLDKEISDLRDRDN